MQHACLHNNPWYFIMMINIGILLKKMISWIVLLIYGQKILLEIIEPKNSKELLVKDLLWEIKMLNKSQEKPDNILNITDK
jgi:hypothetical protein